MSKVGNAVGERHWKNRWQAEVKRRQGKVVPTPWLVGWLEGGRKRRVQNESYICVHTYIKRQRGRQIAALYLFAGYNSTSNASVGIITFHTLMMTESKQKLCILAAVSVCYTLIPLGVQHRVCTNSTQNVSPRRAAGPVSTLLPCLTLTRTLYHSNGCIYFYIAMNKWHKKAKKRNSDN